MPSGYRPDAVVFARCENRGGAPLPQVTQVGAIFVGAASAAIGVLSGLKPLPQVT
jgi:hypothetical protein